MMKDAFLMRIKKTFNNFKKRFLFLGRKYFVTVHFCLFN